MGFGEACDLLRCHPRVKQLENYLNSKMKYSIFGQRSLDKPGGWARKLYSELSEFVHSRPTSTAVDMWQGSNGPIYVPASFRRVYALYLDTVALSYALVKLARPEFKYPNTKHLFHSAHVLPSKVAVFTYKFLWKP